MGIFGETEEEAGESGVPGEGGSGIGESAAVGSAAAEIGVVLAAVAEERGRFAAAAR